MMRTAIKVEEWSGDSETVGSKSAKPTFGAQPTKPNTTSTSPTKPKPNTSTHASTTIPKGAGARVTTAHGRLKPPFRRLTPAEVEKWKAEGLCYKCDEKFHPNHPCQQAQLTVLVLHANGVEEELSEEPREIAVEADEVEAMVVEISINSVVGLTSPRTMKLRATLFREDVIVLIDSGASHNFVSEKLIQKLGLRPSATAAYGVLVAGGVKVTGKGVLNDVELKLPSCTITTSFLPLELRVADVILGVQWLDTLGEMRVNWRSQCMKIWLNNDWVMIRGDLSLHSEAVSFKSLWKAMGKDDEALIVEYGGIQKNEVGLAVVADGDWAELLGQYAGAFAEPTELPPSRGKEHSITLEEGARPVSVRPFRYPQVQKAEIERQIASMLADNPREWKPIFESGSLGQEEGR